MGVTISGISELKKVLQDNIKKEDVKRVVSYHGSRLQEKAVMKAPVDTGNLRRSIDLKLEDDGMTAVITANADYSAYLEYGTRYMEARPYMGPAKNEIEPAFINDLKRLAK